MTKSPGQSGWQLPTPAVGGPPSTLRRWVTAVILGVVIALAIEFASAEIGLGIAAVWVGIVAGGLAAGRIVGATRWGQYVAAFLLVLGALVVFGVVLELVSPISR
jgi:hypothetical protein